MLDCSLHLMHERVAITSLAIHAQTDAVHPEMQEPELHESARAFIDGMIDRAVARASWLGRRRALRADAAGAAVGLAMTGLNGGAERVECVQAIKRMLTGTLLRR